LITDKIDKKFHKKSSKKRTQQAENVKFFMNQKVKMKNEEIHSRFWVWVLVHHMNMCRCFFVNCVWSKENFSEEEWVRRREKKSYLFWKKNMQHKKWLKYLNNHHYGFSLRHTFIEAKKKNKAKSRKKKNEAKKKRKRLFRVQ
jgi:hypothetical protein